MSGLELSLQVLPGLVTAEEEISVEALEVTVDVLERRNRFDSCNRCTMALGGEAGAFCSVKSLDAVVAIIESGGEVRSSAAGFSSANLTIVDDDYSATGASELVRRRHSGNP